jgi:hypothetical protein
MKKKLAYEEVMANLCRVGIDYHSSADCEIEILRGTFEKCDDEVLYPYIPMRLVALMEGYFQELYSNIIDADAKYRRNFAELVKDVQFELSMIDSFEQNTITFGEYASMLLPCNHLEDILTNITTLLETDRLKDEFNDTSILADVKEIFKYRHIFCHEIAGNIRLEHEKILKMIDSASELMKRIGGFVSGILYPKSPELTLDIINEAQKNFERKDKELHDLIKWLEENVDFEYWGINLDFMEVFEEYRKKRAEKVCENYEDGSLYGYFYAQSKKESTEELINGLKKNFRHFLRGYNASH